jgi:hypothetical protein
MKQSEAKAAFLQQHLKKGELYAGILLGQNGEPDQHIILLPGDQASTNWQAQMDWAASVGGSLPTRREQSLLFANLKDQFQGSWYWSCETYQPNNGCAWCQTFGYGTQFDLRKYLSCRARAVRRLVIE